MSRIGKIPIEVSKDVKVSISAGCVQIQGKNGSLDLNIPHGIKVAQNDGKLVVSSDANTKQNRSNHGTIRARLANMVKGVVDGHRKDLEIQGIGFRGQMQGKKIVFNFGFSHPVEFEAPENIKVTLPTQTSIIVEGADNVLVGQVAAKIRALKPVEPYKGKGVRYVGEIVRQKQGKSVAK